MRPNSVNAVDAKDKPAYVVAGNVYTIITSGAETNGTFAAIDMEVLPNGGPGPHAHRDIDETFYVLEGEVVFKSETQRYTASKGACVNIPLGGAVHCFKNESGKPARLLCIVKPAGLDAFFAEIGRPVLPNQTTSTAPPTEEEKQRAIALAAEYGQEMFPPDYLDK